MAAALNDVEDAVLRLEKLAAANPGIFDDKNVLRLHQLGAKLQFVLVSGMIMGHKPDTRPAPTKFPRLYGGTRP